VRSPGIPLADLAKGGEEHFPILVISKNRLAAVALAHHVIKCTFMFNPQR